MGRNGGEKNKTRGVTARIGFQPRSIEICTRSEVSSSPVINGTERVRQLKICHIHSVVSDCRRGMGFTNSQVLYGSAVTHGPGYIEPTGRAEAEI